MNDEDEGYETSASTSADGEPIDGTQEAATAAAVTAGGDEAPSWGFEEKKSRFTKEVAMAFVVIVLLVSLFGIIVWKQFFKSGKTPQENNIANKEPEKQEKPETQEPPMQPMQPMEVADNDPMAVPMQTEPMVQDPPMTEVAERTADLFNSPNNVAGRPTGIFDRQPMTESPLTSEPTAADDPFNNGQPMPMTNVAARPMNPAGNATVTTEIMVNDTAFTDRPVEQPEVTFDDPPNRNPVKPSIDTNEFRVTETFEQPQQRVPQPRPMLEPDPLDEPVRRTPVVTRVEEPRTLDAIPVTEDCYIVQEGDNFWGIAKKVYGNAGLFLALYEYNRQTAPNKDLLRPGMKLRTPDCATLQSVAINVTEGLPDRPVGRIVQSETKGPITRVAQDGPHPAGIFETEKGLKVYRVGEGDTLMKIATRHLGRAERWKQIYNMNRDQLKDQKVLPIGQELVLPADASPTPLVGAIASGR